MTHVDSTNLDHYNRGLLTLAHSIVDTGKDISTDNSKRIKATSLVQYGVLLVKPNGELVDTANEDVLREVLSTVGYYRSMFNNQFRGSWDIIADTPLDELYVEQLKHYMSTYGMESLGLKATPYIPVDKCKDIFKDLIDPDEAEKISIITVVDYETSKDIVNNVLTTMEKPNQRDAMYMRDMLSFIHEDMSDKLSTSLDDIKSFEFTAMYCYQSGLVPSDPQTFLRCAIYNATGSTLIIKNKQTIDAIKAGADKDAVTRMFQKADQKELSSIFLRNKPLFLAFKANPQVAPTINKIRRLAVHNHKPLPEVTVANTMKLLSEGRIDDVKGLIDKIDTRNAVKLYNYSLSALTPSDDVIYNIRNGKTFTTSHVTDEKCARQLKALCLAKLTKDLSGRFVGKTFYIPEDVNYTVPASEKQMLGNIPYGTSIKADNGADAMCVSIAWNNDNDQRTDIDLHLRSANQSFGWNSSYRSEEDAAVLYSGDMTDATNGATETFRIKVNETDPYLVSTNLFSGSHDASFKVFLSAAEDFRKKESGMVDISKALTTPINMSFDGQNSLSLGYVMGDRFIVYGGSMGASIVPKPELYSKALNAIRNRCENMLSLDEFITLGGGNIVFEKTDDAIDLSPENITKTALFELIDGDKDTKSPQKTSKTPIPEAVADDYDASDSASDNEYH